MPIVGFNFDKILVEKNKKVEKNMQLKTDVSITEVQEEKLPTGDQNLEGLRFNFKFELKYEPKIGEINIQGFIYYLTEPKLVKDVIKGWKKDKSIPKPITAEIINMVLYRANIKALLLSQEVNLPPHLNIPRISEKSKAKDYIG